MPHTGAYLLVGGVNNKTRDKINFGGYLVFDGHAIIIFTLIYRCDNRIRRRVIHYKAIPGLQMLK